MSKPKESKQSKILRKHAERTAKYEAAKGAPIGKPTKPATETEDDGPITTYKTRGVGPFKKTERTTGRGHKETQ